MPIDAIKYLTKNFQSHTVTINGITLAKYFRATNNYKSETLISQNLINIVLQGQKTLYLEHGQEVVIKEGEAFFLAKGEYVMSEAAKDGEYICLLIFFDEKVTSKLYDLMQNIKYEKSQKWQVFFKFNIAANIKATAMAFLDLAEQKPHFADELLFLKLQELILLILGSDDGAKFVSYFQSSMCHKPELKIFMRENFTKQWSLSDFANNSYRSLSAFKSEFYATFGESPIKWVWHQRLNRAKFLLDNGECDIGSIAHRCGFKTHAHFSREFKKRFGKTPSETLEIKN